MYVHVHVHVFLNFLHKKLYKEINCHKIHHPHDLFLILYDYSL